MPFFNPGQNTAIGIGLLFPDRPLFLQSISVPFEQTKAPDTQK